MNEEDREKLLKILIEVLNRPNIDGAPFLDIEKVFYHIRNRLSEDNEIRDLLPYYWYVDGYMSDTVSGAVHQGVVTGVLNHKPTTATGTGTWYSLNESNGVDLPETNGDVEEAIGKIDEVLENDYSFFDDYETKIENIYKDTPYEFQRYFKIRVLFEVEAWREGGILDPSKDELKDRFAICETYLPLEEEFREFNVVFGRFVNLAIRYLEQVDEENKPLADTFVDLTYDVWELFCRKLRIEAHDEYYESEVERWGNIFQEKKRLVIADMDEFESMMDEVFLGPRDSATRAEDSSAWSRVVESYLDLEEHPAAD